MIEIYDFVNVNKLEDYVLDSLPYIFIIKRTSYTTKNDYYLYISNKNEYT